MTKEFKTCEVCTIYLDVTPLYKTYKNSKEKKNKKQILIGSSPSLFKSSLINPNRDDRCVGYKGKLLRRANDYSLT